MSPCKPVDESFCLLFFRQTFGGGGGGGIFLSQIAGQKTTNEQRAYATFQGLSLENGVDIWTFVRRTRIDCVVAL